MEMTTATDKIRTEYLKSTKTIINTQIHHNLIAYRGPTGIDKVEQQQTTCWMEPLVVACEN